MDEKELVEYWMLVDFGWNDIGKIVEMGLVYVFVYFIIERYCFLMYLVLVVEGILKFGFIVMDVFWLMFLVGIVSGVLKIRVMEWIYEWENVKCGLYVGVVGYLIKNGDLDFVFLIRIMVFYNGKVYV